MLDADKNGQISKKELTERLKPYTIKAPIEAAVIQSEIIKEKDA